MSLMVMGSLPSVPSLPKSGTVGEAWFVNGEMFVWSVKGCWIWMQTTPGTLAREKSALIGTGDTIESELTWQGIPVNLLCGHDIKSMFSDPDALTKGDMGIFQMTYPELFEEFQKQWLEKWITEKAKREFDNWREDYHEKN